MSASTVASRTLAAALHIIIVFNFYRKLLEKYPSTGKELEEIIEIYEEMRRTLAEQGEGKR